MDGPAKDDAPPRLVYGVYILAKHRQWYGTRMVARDDGRTFTKMPPGLDAHIEPADFDLVMRVINGEDMMRHLREARDARNVGVAAGLLLALPSFGGTLLVSAASEACYLAYRRAVKKRIRNYVATLRADNEHAPVRCPNVVFALAGARRPTPWPTPGALGRIRCGTAQMGPEGLRTPRDAIVIFCCEATLPASRETRAPLESDASLS